MAAASTDELMPDADLRDDALERIGAVVEHAEEIWPRLFPGDERRVMLSAGERDVLQEMSLGLSREEAAESLLISVETVKMRLKGARLRLDAKSTLHAVAEALRRGLIE
jgi:DNA-binding CsgD family transcriptional regulator